MQSSTRLSVSLGEIELRQKNVVNSRKTIKDKYILEMKGANEEYNNTQTKLAAITTTAKVKRVWRRNWPAAPMPKPSRQNASIEIQTSIWSSLLFWLSTALFKNRRQSNPQQIPPANCLCNSCRHMSGRSIAIETHWSDATDSFQSRLAIAHSRVVAAMTANDNRRQRQSDFFLFFFYSATTLK